MALPNKKARRDVVHVAHTISCGTVILPAGVEAASGIVTKIFMCLDVKSLLKVLESCLVKRLCVLFNSQDFVRVRHEALAYDYSGHRCITEMIHNPKQLYLLYKRYKNEFPRGTPFVCACQYGRVEDVNQFLNLHRFHAYIDVGTANAGMDVTAMVSELGTSSYGDSMSPLIAAAIYERSTIIEILLQYNADTATATTDHNGRNALHWAAQYNTTTTTTVQLLLNNMKLEDINHKDTLNGGDTPLDYCYLYNTRNSSSITQQLIDLIRQKGGKRGSEL